MMYNDINIYNAICKAFQVSGDICRNACSNYFIRKIQRTYVGRALYFNTLKY